MVPSSKDLVFFSSAPAVVSLYLMVKLARAASFFLSLLFFWQYTLCYLKAGKLVSKMQNGKRKFASGKQTSSRFLQKCGAENDPCCPFLEPEPGVLERSGKILRWGLAFRVTACDAHFLCVRDRRDGK